MTSPIKEEVKPRRRLSILSCGAPSKVAGYRAAAYGRSFTENNANPSVSVLPSQTYLNLGLGELAHTKLIVELGDGTVKYPKGIAKNVLVGIVLEVMDAYSIEVTVDVIVGETFLKEIRIKARRFGGMITIYNGNEEVTYQMDLAKKKSTMLVKYLQSGNLEVLES
ncbi:hypothetical protein Tco_1025088 [Tanacetum coccineum]